MPIKKIAKGARRARKLKSSRKKPARKRLTIGIGPAKVKISKTKVFFKKLYNDPTPGGQMSFQGMGPRKWKFNTNVTIPADTFKKTRAHIGRNKLLYAHGVGAGLSGVTAYAGSYLANRRSTTRRRRR